MTWQQIPAALELETDGEIWAEVPLDFATRCALAVVCTEQRQSLETIIHRALRRKIREFKRARPDAAAA